MAGVSRINLGIPSSSLVYHGGPKAVYSPIILSTGYPKDFGYGFYVTRMLEQAQRWAARKSSGVVSVFGLDTCYRVDPGYLSFDSVNSKWLDFIASCRAGQDSSSHSIVEGPMADDVIWTQVDAYLRGDIPRDAMLEIARFRHPTHQIVFRTQEAIDRYLVFKEEIAVG